MIDVVCSVPHSGTRTLVVHLGIGKNSPAGRWMHFGYADDEVRIASGKYHLHIPVRHPMVVASSWARRGKNLDRLISAYMCMFAHLHRPHTLHRMEDLPVLAGGDDHDRLVRGDTLVAEYRERVMEEIVKPNHDWFIRRYGV